MICLRRRTAPPPGETKLYQPLARAIVAHSLATMKATTATMTESPGEEEAINSMKATAATMTKSHPMAEETMTASPTAEEEAISS